ncbi:tripartite tricarboxylate transporter substrate binding protein [Variovorax sp. E3]|uniref:Bug family tripartite tricarboxylate transporter substrate binding protein n=1 Tax=Variovorax sp. E3 TaxID=1914993 RepID=UPI0018DB35EA|nr:tripartite tricarboxylate transporter substrate-binding protein [Variovorax sp. E3]
MTHPPLRRALLGLAAAGLLCGPAASWAATDAAYPTKPVTIIVPFPAGGGTDVIFRSVQIRLQAALGVSVIIDNRAGAGGTVGTGFGAKATPDGYTLVAATTTTIASAEAVYPKLPYDPLKDLAPVGTIGTTPFVLVVTPALAARDLEGFVDYAKANPKALNYGSIGNGSLSHLTGELFKQRTGIEMTHVPYRGAAPAQSDLMGGQIQALFDNPPALMAQVRGGRMRALAISEPSAGFTDVPSFEQAGIKDFKPQLWYGLMAPAATPPPVLQRLRTALDKVMHDPALRADMLSKGVTPWNVPPETFAAQIRGDIKLWGGIARSVNAKAD